MSADALPVLAVFVTARAALVEHGAFLDETGVPDIFRLKAVCAHFQVVVLKCFAGAQATAARRSVAVAEQRRLPTIARKAGARAAAQGQFLPFRRWRRRVRVNNECICWCWSRMLRQIWLVRAETSQNTDFLGDLRTWIFLVTRYFVHAAIHARPRQKLARDCWQGAAHSAIIEKARKNCDGTVMHGIA